MIERRRISFKSVEIVILCCYSKSTRPLKISVIDIVLKFFIYSVFRIEVDFVGIEGLTFRVSM